VPGDRWNLEASRYGVPGLSRSIYSSGLELVFIGGRSAAPLFSPKGWKRSAALHQEGGSKAMTMRRRDLIVPAAAPALLRTRSFAATRPNIIYIIVHDLGTALGSYGDPNVRTPRLDEFAAQGVRFTNYFCCSTCCSPSRGCIMTGRYAHTNGLIGLANRNWHLPDSELTIVDYLNQAGYETVNIGGQPRPPARSRCSPPAPAGRTRTAIAK